MNNRALSILVAVSLMLVACTNPTSWYPSEAASVTGSYEVDDGTVKSVVVTISLQNTGDSTISFSTFTVKAQTDVRAYWKTATVDTRILPGATIKESVELTYATIAEAMVVDGASIIDPFFE